MPRIQTVQFEPLNVELKEPFGIASGAQLRAENVLVSVTLDDGTRGYGEAAPFPAVSGENQSQTLAALLPLAQALEGEDSASWKDHAARLKHIAPDAPAARCAIETALLDAHFRSQNISLWTFFGGKEPELTTDITITTGSIDHAFDSAARAAKSGFSTLKLKVGGGDDVERIRAVIRAAPDARLVLDANAAFTADQALALLDALGPDASRVALFEQPVARDDYAGLCAIKERVLVAADESARSVDDVMRLAEERACDVVNIKITKTGVVEAMDIVALAKSSGLGLMIGGMVETRLAMTLSACLAAGTGGFSFVDLDTPLFMKCDPFRGGMAQHGARIRVDAIESGLGIEPLTRTG